MSQSIDATAAHQKLDSAWTILFKAPNDAVRLIDDVLRQTALFPDSTLARAHNMRAIAHSLNGEVEETVNSFERAVQHAVSLPDVRFVYMRNYAMSLKDAERFEEAIGVAEEVRQHWADTENQMEESRAWATLGNIFLMKGDMEQATRHLLEGLAKSDPQSPSDFASHGSTLNNLAMLYHKAGQHQIAIEYFERARKSLLLAQRPIQACRAHLNAEGCLIEMRDTANLERSVLYMQGLIRELGEEEIPHRVLGRFAGHEAILNYWIHGGMADFERVWLKFGNVMEGQLGFLIEWGEAQINSTSPQNFETWFEEIQSVSGVDVHRLREDLKSLTFLAASLSTDPSSKQLVLLREQAVDQLNRNAAVLRGEFLVRDLERKVESIEQEKRFQAEFHQLERSRFLAIVVCLFAVLIALISWFKRMGAQRKQEVEWLKTKKEIAELALNERIQDLAIHMLSLAEMQRHIGKHAEVLSEYNVPRDLVRSLKRMGSFERNRNRFRQEFETLFPQFQSALLQFFPDLSASEMDVACLVTMGMSQLEMAQTLGVTHGAIRTRLHRLRQRIGASKQKEVIELLQKIGTS